MSDGDIYVKIKATPEFITSLFTRDEQGNRLVLELGEQDAEGFHTPTITRDTSDNLVAAYAEVVQKVAEDEWWCPSIGLPDPETWECEAEVYCLYCDGDSQALAADYEHEPGCVYMAARKLRGMA